MSLPDSMLAARCLAYGLSPPLNIVRVPIPTPKSHEVLIKVSAASLCHTDIAMCQGDKINEGNTIPQTAGHEPCGVIVKVGDRVTGFQAGDRVGFVNHAGSCGEFSDNGWHLAVSDSRRSMRGVPKRPQHVLSGQRH
jgi:D-arabinose 1-dehydrogenase-like Zn-dependent alcohol dehydrogenase